MENAPHRSTAGPNLASTRTASNAARRVESDRPPNRAAVSFSIVKACSTWMPARLSEATADTSPPHLRARRDAAFIRNVER